MSSTAGTVVGIISIVVALLLIGLIIYYVVSVSREAGGSNGTDTGTTIPDNSGGTETGGEKPSDDGSCPAGKTLSPITGLCYTASSSNGGTTATTKCCWNRSMQECSADSDCDAGGEGCVESGATTAKYGKVTCNTCEMKGMQYDPATYSCVPKAKCCWNRVVQGCSADSDCDPGGEGCIESGGTTAQFGKVQCNTCEMQGLQYDASSGSCIGKSYAQQTVTSPSGQQYIAVYQGGTPNKYLNNGITSDITQGTCLNSSPLSIKQCGSADKWTDFTLGDNTLENANRMCLGAGSGGALTLAACADNYTNPNFKWQWSGPSPQTKNIQNQGTKQCLEGAPLWNTSQPPKLAPCDYLDTQSWSLV